MFHPGSADHDLPMKLILFDVDGTLIRSNGVGRRAMIRTVEHVLGDASTLADINMGGMTDPLIITEAMDRAGYHADEVTALLPQLLRRYPGELARGLAPSWPEPKPEPQAGVRELLSFLSDRDDAIIGLLTGNIETGAWLKLHACGLHEYFTFGAFGDEGPERPKLPSIAVERAWEESGHRFEGPDVVIVGDTPHDVTCGRHLDVHAVTVTTGPYDAAALEAAGADEVLPDLTEIDVVLAAFGLESLSDSRAKGN